MVASFRDGRSDVVRVEGLDVDLLRVAGIYGPNAAGKSNVLAALAFMREAVADARRQWRPEGPIPREPFLLDATSREEPSLFEVDLLIQGVRYQYGFKLDSERILEEWLYVYPKKRRQVWFARDADAAEPFFFGKELKGSNRTIEGLTRKNRLFLSMAAEYNHPALGPLYYWFSKGLFHLDGEARLKATLATMEMLDGRYREKILEFLRLADLGIVDLQVKEEKTSLTIAEMMELIREGAMPTDSSDVYRLELRHRSKGGQVSLPFEKESRGTQVWLALLGPLLETLESGGILCIDELDTSLHPHLAAELLRIFLDSKRNPQNAQLIFNTHDATLLGNLLGAPSLHRDQIWFVDKDEEGATYLYPLTDFKPRKLENLERGYLQGRYHAIPFIEASLNQNA
ncbi:MAG TPA: ATP-binding protein [Thermoanaerobaculia bacterium]